MSRKLIVQQFLTVDGIMANADGGMDFVDAKPFAQSEDEAFKAEAVRFMERIDTMIIGAKTYQMFKSYWPTAASDGEGDFADRLNTLDKYVASTSLAEAPWGSDDSYAPATVTADPVTTIRELKASDGKDIVLWGSVRLMRAMFAAGLVDEIQLRICPTTRGDGIRMFDDKLDLELIESQAYERGVIVSKYKVLNR